jgi:class 3 adenylate cyclase
VGEAPAGTATVLFTDVVGSTALRARLGDAAADDVMRRHEHVLADIVTGQGGSVVKGLGDGVMATFGGAADAVLAAIAIEREILRTNRRTSDERRFEVRIGISAGDITWADGDCHGTPVVTASRLCNAADGGQIVCDDLVRGLARGRNDLAFSVVGELTLKGLAEAVMAYQVGWEDTRAEDTTQLPAVAPFPASCRCGPRNGPARRRKQRRATARRCPRGEPGVGKGASCVRLARAARRHRLVCSAGATNTCRGRCAVDRGLAHAHHRGGRAGAARVASGGELLIVQARDPVPISRRRRRPTPRPNVSCCSARSSTS